MKALNNWKAVELKYAYDKRKRRRQHRRAARELLKGGFLNGYSAPGTTFWYVAQWHLKQAIALCYH